MYRIDNSTAAAALPAPTAPGTNPDSYFTKGDPAAPVPATAVDDEWLNMVQEEIANVILGGGFALDKSARNQLFTSIAAMILAATPSLNDQRVFAEGVAFAVGVADGDLVLWDAVASKFDKALADTIPNSLAVGVADVTNSEVTFFGEVRTGLFSGLTPGERYFLDATAAGAVTLLAPTIQVKAGVAKTADVLFVDVDRLSNPGDLSIGKHTMSWAAESFIPTITNGCGWFTRDEIAANTPEIGYLNYDPIVEENSELRIPMPKSWDGGDISIIGLWSHGVGATAFGVAWGFKAAFIKDADARPVFGAEVIVTDVGGIADTLYTTVESVAITPSGTPTTAADGVLVLRTANKVADAGYTIDTKARLEGIKLLFTTDLGTDA